KGPRMLSPKEFRHMLEISHPQYRAMLLLGLNCAFGNTDVARIPRTAFDLESGWVEFPRPKTGTYRKAWLWPETVEALRVSPKHTRQPADPGDKELMFVTPRKGLPWVHVEIRPDNTLRAVDNVCNTWKNMSHRGGVKRNGVGFYTLRRTFRTIADETLDQPACDLVMGHVGGGMAAVYRQQIGDDRIRRVCEHVRRWAFDLPAEDSEK
ncbi:hypothetical protein, partial [Saccharicrinis sp. FJH54]|uniref:hypothetical protein n=1 Tax=Saccharicrinis sp. FJH54 TaxID=3344665 RepID=UPI0035D46AFD